MHGAARLGLVVLLLLGGACQRIRIPLVMPWGGYNEEYFARKPLETFSLVTEKGVPKDTVIGEPRKYRVREGDTLLDVARAYDLGYNEIVEANPTIDPWLPPVGTTIVIPTAWVLPCCTYEGMVVNIPEMRLYFYRRLPKYPNIVVVNTYPVGLGRDDRRTPRGKFKIRGKTVNPRWVIPESIRREHIKESGDARTSIAGGDPENPLGKHRFELTLPRYAIHGTNIPWGVGMKVSHGCARLYPEDMAHLFPLVPVGTRGEFTYQTIKVGRRDGAVYVEAHPDIYGYTPGSERLTTAALKRQNLSGRVDPARLRTARTESRGLPVVVSAVNGGRSRRP
jgi:L,D-transpeptidase ErfK/SrfK